ncbi:MAG: FCD domain-containing protein [Actinophytocola sp.]|nr:FCD domain-containing protein [Actinophytocola sp.]
MTSSDQLWEPLGQGRVSERIARRVLDVIESERLTPGSRLPAERELATMLGVSRPSLREAMRSLEARGRVDIRHGQGVFVTEPAATRGLRSALSDSEMTLVELFDMREVLELPAAAWAATRQDPQRLARVREAYEQLDEASRQDPVDWDRLQALDEAFHLRIVEAAGNRFLSKTRGVLHEILAAGMQTTLTIPGRLERSRQDHERIFTAIMAGDGPAARRAARAHIAGARTAALRRSQQEEALDGA